MNKNSILHIPMSEYAHGITENKVVIRLRTARDDITKCTLFYGDRSCRKTPVIFSSQRMEVVAQDEFFDYYETTLTDCYKRLCYYFQLEKDEEQVLYYGDLFSYETVDDRSEYYQFPYNHKADIASPPGWVKDAVIYNIFPDSFATSKKYISGKSTEKIYNNQKVKGKLGGTINGITENLDYLKNLGFNAIYINPIFTAGEYHKYDLLDYFQIDPCFGTNEDFKKLVDTAHSMGIKVIIDGVFNHCSWRFFAFEDVVKNGEKSKYKDWFNNVKFPVIRPDNPEDYPEYECFGYERMMPKMNTSNPEVVDYFCKVCKYWIREFNIDGWRLDVASEVNSDFWRVFRKAAKEENPDVVIIGEVWETAKYWLDGTQFDSTMNYDFRKHCRYFFAENKIDALQFDTRVTNMRMRYRKNIFYAQLNLLDSHDVSRFYSLCGEDSDKMKLAILFQMTFIGAPCVFYGDEQGLTGIKECDYRQKMIWDKRELFTFYKKAIKLRNENEELRRGDYKTIKAEKESKIYSYCRYINDSEIYVVLNSGENTEALPKEVLNKTVIWSNGIEGNSIKGYGFLIVSNKE